MGSLRNCYQCGREIPKVTEKCPYCGQSFVKYGSTVRRLPLLHIILAQVFILSLLALVVYAVMSLLGGDILRAVICFGVVVFIIMVGRR